MKLAVPFLSRPVSRPQWADLARAGRARCRGSVRSFCFSWPVQGDSLGQPELRVSDWPAGGGPAPAPPRHGSSVLGWCLSMTVAVALVDSASATGSAPECSMPAVCRGGRGLAARRRPGRARQHPFKQVGTRPCQWLQRELEPQSAGWRTSAQPRPHPAALHGDGPG
jgi:hypothetical protein